MRCLEKARRIGGTFVVSLDVAASACGYAFTADGTLDYNPSRGVDEFIVGPSKRQSKTLLRECARHLDMLSTLLGFDVVHKVGVEKIVLRNGRFIEALPANPDTIRGSTGNMTFEEVQAIRNPEEVWAAAKSVADPTNGRPNGYRVRACGTTLGDNSLLHRIMHTDFGDDFSRHRVDIYRAVAAGFPADIDRLRREAGSEEAFAQEYECKSVSASTQYISADLLATAFYDPECDLPPGSRVATYCGMDVGRMSDGDPSVITDIEEHTDGTIWATACEARRGEEWADQEEWVGDKLRGPTGAEAIGIDATGMGHQFAERLTAQYSESVVRPYWFSVPVKDQLMTGLKAAISTGRLRIPDDDLDLHRDILNIRREIKKSGRITYDAARTKKGHADRAWSLALGVDVCSQGGGGREDGFETIDHSGTRSQMSTFL